MIEKKNLIINETFVSAVENHKKGNFQIAEKLYREILKSGTKYIVTGWMHFPTSDEE